MLLLLLSRFSCVRLCVTPQKAAHQAPPSLGFSRQEHWSGLPFPSPTHESEKSKWSRSVVSNWATPWTAAHQAPPSVGFSRQECWSGVPLPSPIIKARIYQTSISVRCFINIIFNSYKKTYESHSIFPTLQIKKLRLTGLKITGLYHLHIFYVNLKFLKCEAYFEKHIKTFLLLMETFRRKHWFKK